MKLLDQLKKEAAAIKARQEKPEIEAPEKNAQILQVVRPGMQALYDYLNQLVEQLNTHNPEVSVSYEVEGYGTLSKLEQVDYKLIADNVDDLEKFTLSFVRKGEGLHKFQRKTKDGVKRQKEYLWSHGLRFESKLSIDGVGTFSLRPNVPVTFEFSVDLKKPAVRLQITNHDILGRTIYRYEPEMIDDAFMDELAKYVLRRPNQFNELSGNTVSDETRQRLRRQVEAIQREQQILMEQVPPPPPTKMKRIQNVLWHAWRLTLVGACHGVRFSKILIDRAWRGILIAVSYLKPHCKNLFDRKWVRSLSTVFQQRTG
jgi:hypothetical protein